MIKEAIEKIISLAPIQTIDIEGVTYSQEKGELKRIKRPPDHPPVALPFRTLNGLAAYCLENPDNIDLSGDCFLVIKSHAEVCLYGELLPQNDNKRFTYATAQADPIAFKFDVWMPVEDMIIALQTCFAPAPEDSRPDDVAAIIALIANMASEHIHLQVDDQFSQRVEVRSGLSTKSSIKVENPVLVRAWRTFPEIEQPETPAILRFREADQGMPKVALFESASTQWQLITMANIKAWLKDHLAGIRIIA